MKPATDQELNRLWDEIPSLEDTLRAIYNLGVKHGRQQSAKDRPLWPEPITDRPPTKDDLDAIGLVQVLDERGNWILGFRQEAAKGRWRHTPNWQPKPPTLKEQALKALDGLAADLKAHGLGADLKVIRHALEAQP
jgi:hypothetical protein